LRECRSGRNERFKLLGGLAGLALPLFLFISPTGFIVANSIAGALADFPERAGAVSALVGAIQYGSGIIGSALVGAFAVGTPRRWAG
jgi:DHA1 family bicyclomycin/chloramphenicol resistance-like MFS transporter